MGPLRARKDAAEVEALRRAGAAADRVAAELQAGDIELVGRTEAQVSAELGRRLRAEGHHRVNFAIVAAGANAASPHHEPGDRVIAEGEVVLCDFGGTMFDDDGIGYCSDITRCVHLGEPSAEMAEAYAVLLDAQQAAVAAAVVGTPCEEVDATARRIITEAGWGEQFIHRTGHGIGIEEHEDPYIVSGNGTPLEPGHAFSIEPGIYVAGRFGFRLEDIVVAADAGPDPLNRADHDLALALIRLDAATVLLQWAVGGLLFLLGHHPPARGVARLRLAAARHLPAAGGRAPSSPGCATASRSRCATWPARAWCWPPRSALAVSIQRRRAGVAGERDRVEARQRAGDGDDRHRPAARGDVDVDAPEFPPVLDLRRAGHRRSSGWWRRGSRPAIRPRSRSPASWSGAAFLGAVTDAMLLGHWYLVQPGMPRGPLLELVRWVAHRVAVRGGRAALADGHGRR